MVAIGLTVRSQIGQARLVAPDADIYHGMAYMGIPVALALGRRQGASAVIYDARDIYVDTPPELLRAEAQRARAVITCTEYNRQYLSGQIGSASSDKLRHPRQFFPYLPRPSRSLFSLPSD